MRNSNKSYFDTTLVNSAMQHRLTPIKDQEKYAALSYRIAACTERGPQLTPNLIRTNVLAFIGFAAAGCRFKAPLGPVLLMAFGVVTDESCDHKTGEACLH